MALTPGLITRHPLVVLKVSGPLPGHPTESGEFVMEISRFGHRRLWWITV